MSCLKKINELATIKGDGTTTKHTITRLGLHDMFSNESVHKPSQTNFIVNKTRCQQCTRSNTTNSKCINPISAQLKNNQDPIL